MSQTLNNDAPAALNREIFMVESEEFLNSLNHDNPGRPHFAIGTGIDAPLTITHQGQVMQLPMAEVLNFAQRWKADQDLQCDTGKKTGGLRIFPYPLYRVRIQDADAVNVGWSAV